jgi:pimeloyl-ACP methyl ester carboxylesterase
MRLVRRLITALALVVVLPVSGFAQDRFFDSNGVRIRYVEQGAGEVVVLIHGNGGSLQGWVDSGVLPDLARNYRVVALDARGHGKSGKPHEARAYGREMGLDVVRLLDHLGVRRAHIVGYSMGANITAMLLTSHPDRFITATLGGASGRRGWTAADTARVEQEASEKERDCVSRTQIRRLAAVGQPPPTDDEIRKRSEACMADPGQDRFALAGSLNDTVSPSTDDPRGRTAASVGPSDRRSSDW